MKKIWFCLFFFAIGCCFDPNRILKLGKIEPAACQDLSYMPLREGFLDNLAYLMDKNKNRLCSGIVISDHYVLTVAHVVDSSPSLLWYRGRFFEISFMSRYFEFDLAVFKSRSPLEFSPVTLLDNPDELLSHPLKLARLYSGQPSISGVELLRVDDLSFNGKMYKKILVCRGAVLEGDSGSIVYSDSKKMALAGMVSLNGATQNGRSAFVCMSPYMLHKVFEHLRLIEPN